MGIKQNIKRIQSEREREVAGLYSGMLTKLLQLYHICIRLPTFMQYTSHTLNFSSFCDMQG